MLLFAKYLLQNTVIYCVMLTTSGRIWRTLFPSIETRHTRAPFLCSHPRHYPPIYSHLIQDILQHNFETFMQSDVSLHRTCKHTVQGTRDSALVTVLRSRGLAESSPLVYIRVALTTRQCSPTRPLQLFLMCSCLPLRGNDVQQELGNVVAAISDQDASRK